MKQDEGSGGEEAENRDRDIWTKAQEERKQRTEIGISG